MNSRYLFVGGPVDGLKMDFKTPIPYRIKVSNDGKMLKINDMDDCEWPYYSPIAYSMDPDLHSKEKCVGKYIFVDKCPLLDEMMLTMKSN